MIAHPSATTSFRQQLQRWMTALPFFAGQHPYRIALYGIKASGKTCILSALSLPRTPHPEGLTCTWIETVPGHPLPQGHPDKWQTNDPFHLGWKWLHEQRQRLRSGDVPQPNPLREDVMRFMFAFGAPDQGTRQVELIDYSGELLTASASELAARLRDNMRVCDGLLVLAEVPFPGQEQSLLSEDFEKIKGAFLCLLKEHATGAQPEWPIAVLFNKWDRRGYPLQAPDLLPDDMIREFLNSAPPPPHASLVQTLCNAVGPTNVRCFPVSAFGKHQILSDGREVPVFQDSQLQSYRLEDGFIWVIHRSDELEVQALERAARSASWWAAWQTPLGSSPLSDQSEVAPMNWLRGVSPLRSLAAAWTCHKRLKPQSDLFTRTSQVLHTLGLKLGSHLVVCLLLILLLITAVQTILDGVRYRSVLTAIANPSATAEQLKDAEKWLEEYYKSPGYFRWLSFPLILNRMKAGTHLAEFRTRRDNTLWKKVADAQDPYKQVERAREYLEAFPIQGLHSAEAYALVKEAQWRQGIQKNLAYLKNLEVQINNIPVDATTDVALLDAFYKTIDALPEKEIISEEVEKLQRDLRARIAEKHSQIAQRARQAKWEEFRQMYLSLIHSGDIRGAARELVQRKLQNDPELKDLMSDFSKNAPLVIDNKVRQHLKIRAFTLAREATNAINDKNVQQLLSPSDLKALRQLEQTIDETEDRDLYWQILKNRPHCGDQVSAYLQRAPLKTMAKEVREYQKWLEEMNRPLDLTLELTAIWWDPNYYSYFYTYYNDVTVQLRGEPLISVADLKSSPGERSADVGNGSFRARRSETITIDVIIVAKYRGLWTSTTPGGAGSWSGTIEHLRSGVTINLIGNNNAFVNKASFSLKGLPQEPELPPWSR